MRSKFLVMLLGARFIIWAAPCEAKFQFGLGKAAAHRSVAIQSDAVAGGLFAVDCFPHSPPYRTDGSLAVDPADHNIVYVGVEHRGFYKTTDGGSTWNRVITGLKAFQKKDGTGLCYEEFFDTAIDPQNPNHVCFAQAGSPGTLSVSQAQYNGIYCTENGGVTWTQKVTSSMNTALISIAIDPTNSDVLYAGANGNAASYSGADPNVYFNTVGVIYKSSDRGTNWTELSTGFVPGLRANRLRVDPTDNNIVYASMYAKVGSASGVNTTQYGVLKTVDGGVSWTSHTSGMNTDAPEYQALVNLDLSPQNPARLYVSATSIHQYLSTTSAVSFSTPTVRGGYLSVFAFDPNDAEGDRLIGTDPFTAPVYVSEDGGDHWTAVGTKPSEAANNPIQITDMAFSHQSALVVYMSGSYGSVYKSVDGGVSWTKILSSETLP